MSGTVTINLVRPITSVKIESEYSIGIQSPGLNAAIPDNNTELTGPSLESEKNALSQVCRTLQGLVDKLNQFNEKIFAGHKEEIAKLSIEIARKILAQKVQEGDYKIESIIKEALQNAPTQQDLVVRLNPQDLAQYEKEQPDDALAGIKFIADSNIGLAECLIESPKGIIESSINEHLEHIGKALGNAE